MKILGSWILSVLALSAAIKPANAQSSTESDRYMDQIRDATGRAWRLVIKPRFAEAADDEAEAAQIRATTLEMPRYSNINAWSGDGKIILPYGMIFTINAAVDGLMVAYNEPKTTRKLKEYLNYLAEQNNAARDGKPGPIDPFWIYAGISGRRMKEITSIPGFDDKKAELMVDSFSLVLGHELGHLVLRHPPYNSVSRAQARANEFAADKFGYKLAEKAGFDPIAGVFSVFVIFSIFEHGAIQSAASSTHPVATCRVAALLQIDVDKYEDAPTMPASLARAGMTLTQLKDDAAALEQACHDEISSAGS